MRAVIQKSTGASVTVNGQTVGSIPSGYVVLLGVEQGDTEQDAAYIAAKCAGLRVFEDEEGKLNLSLKDVGGEVLLISQFTLLADARKGRRPSFVKAERPEEADRLYLLVKEGLEKEGLKVQTGVFRTHMQVSLVNDGPVTILLDSRKLF